MRTYNLHNVFTSLKIYTFTVVRNLQSGLDNFSKLTITDRLNPEQLVVQLREC
jgi:hypothetical protein